MTESVYRTGVVGFGAGMAAGAALMRWTATGRDAR